MTGRARGERWYVLWMWPDGVAIDAVMADQECLYTLGPQGCGRQLGTEGPFLLPVVRAQSASGGELQRSAAVVAGCSWYAEGQDEQGNPIDIVDNLKDQVVNAAQLQREARTRSSRIVPCSVPSPTTKDSSPPTWPPCRPLHDKGPGLS